MKWNSFFKIPSLFFYRMFKMFPLYEVPLKFYTFYFESRVWEPLLYKAFAIK